MAHLFTFICIIARSANTYIIHKPRPIPSCTEETPSLSIQYNMKPTAPALIQVFEWAVKNAYATNPARGEVVKKTVVKKAAEPGGPDSRGAYRAIW